MSPSFFLVGKVVIENYGFQGIEFGHLPRGREAFRGRTEMGF
jgi:hypothetical protein